MFLLILNKKIHQTALIMGANGWSSYPAGLCIISYFNLKAILNKQSDFVNLPTLILLVGLFIDIKGKRNYNIYG